MSCRCIVRKQYCQRVCSTFGTKVPKPLCASLLASREVQQRHSSTLGCSHVQNDPGRLQPQPWQHDMTCSSSWQLHCQHTQSEYAECKSVSTALSFDQDWIKYARVSLVGSTALSIVHVCSGTEGRLVAHQPSIQQQIACLSLKWAVAPPVIQLSCSHGCKSHVGTLVNAYLLQKSIASMLPSLKNVIWPYPAIGSRQNTHCQHSANLRKQLQHSCHLPGPSAGSSAAVAAGTKVS